MTAKTDFGQHHLKEHMQGVFYLRLTACRKGDTVKTREEVLQHYIDGESESPVVRFMKMTTHRDVDITRTSPTSERIKKYLEQEETINPIIKEFM